MQDWTPNAKNVMDRLTNHYIVVLFTILKLVSVYLDVQLGKNGLALLLSHRHIGSETKQTCDDYGYSYHSAKKSIVVFGLRLQNSSSSVVGADRCEIHGVQISVDFSGI